MTYRVYARRFRPRSFDEVVGQSHITTTLKNAISMDKLAHAYLFTGPRGTGKTSTARIFAMCLNCKNGPTPNPCNKCSSCSEIKSGTNLDLIEIDGASNRGIDDIRNLRENIKFQPTSGKFKIYIIDESHMLTQEAFNALLKTLEEPPPHVKIILATTQPHRIPLTIASRCQRFDFRKISTKDIILKLKTIVEEERLNIQEDAFFEIAKISDGSLRDAESILEQIGVFSNGEIKFEDITTVLGIVPQEIVFDVTESLINKDSKKALLLIDRLIEEGKDISQFVSVLIEHFRNLLIAKIAQKGSLDSLIELSKEHINFIIKQSESFSLQDIFYIINVLLNTQELIRRHPYDKILLEISMVKLTQRENLVKLDKILNKLSELTTQNEKTILSIQDMPEKNNFPKGTGEIENTSSFITKKPQAGEKNGKKQIRLETVQSCWSQLIETLKDEKMSVATFLLEAKPLEVNDGSLIVGIPDGLTFHRESLERPENKRLIEEILARFIGYDLKLVFTTFTKDIESNIEIEEIEGETVEDTELELTSKEEIIEEPPVEKNTPQDDSIIKLTLKLFGGRIVKEDKSERGL